MNNKKVIEIEGKCIDDTNAGCVLDTDYGVLFLPPKTLKFDEWYRIIIKKQ